MKMESYLAKEEKFNRTTEPHSLPIYPTSSFKFDSIDEGIDLFENPSKGHVYGRYGNPTIEAVAQKIANLEAYELDLDPFGIMVSSGMAAISTLTMGIMKAGDTLLTQYDLYGGTSYLFQNFLTKFGINIIAVDFSDIEQVQNVIESEKSIKMLYCETPANPTMKCIDLSFLASLCKKNDIICAVDNTFSTPYIQQPFKYGFDFVIHSTTKFINGHGNAVTGVIIGKNKKDYDVIWDAMKVLGTNCNAFDAWLVNNGIKTLAIRMERHAHNALELAKRLEGMKEVQRVNYPFLQSNSSYHIAKSQMKNGGGILSFELYGGMEKGINFMNSITLPSLAPTLGNIDTLVVHPASMSHRNVPKDIRLKYGITDGLIRISVGIEDIEDLFHDLAKAIQ